jgi:hypothetical protein
MSQTHRLNYAEWLALATLYKHRDRESSPARYIGLQSTINALMRHHPPLAEWVGKSNANQVHITPEGIALYESTPE